MMADTPVSLLERLRLQPNPASWQRLIDLYAPLIRDWLRRYGVQPSDADDLAQEVLTVLVRELPNFHHDLRRGAFRRWLRTILINRLRVLWRSPKTSLVDPEKTLDQLEDRAGDLGALWDREHDRYVLGRLMELLKAEFEPATWQAFQLVAVEGRSHGEAASTLGVSTNAVRIAKSRVLKRLREEAAGIID
jgi:RNA polymerase sigma factor (sigma-70 family)